MEANKCENVEMDKKDVSDEINEYINQMDELEKVLLYSKRSFGKFI